MCFRFSDENSSKLSSKPRDSFHDSQNGMDDDGLQGILKLPVDDPGLDLDLECSVSDTRSRFILDEHYVGISSQIEKATVKCVYLMAYEDTHIYVKRFLWVLLLLAFMSMKLDY